MEDVEEITKYFAYAGLGLSLLTVPFLFRLKTHRILVAVQVLLVATFIIGRIVDGKQTWAKVFTDFLVLMLALIQVGAVLNLSLSRRELAQSP